MTASAGESALPNTLIIGSAKSGTTSLHEYMGRHPSVFMSQNKELLFFSAEDWHDRLDWYRRQFPTRLPVRGESSPAYSMHPWFSGVPERIEELIPDVRLIYLVRDPIERLVAQYVEFFALRLESRSLREALADYESKENRLVMASRYAFQLDRYRDRFDDGQLLVIEHRDLLEQRERTLGEVFRFVGVDPDFRTTAFASTHNERNRKMRPNRLGLWLHARGLFRPARERTRALPGGVREPLKKLVADPVSTPSLEPSLRAELEAYLREDANRLREYTGKALTHWSV